MKIIGSREYDILYKVALIDTNNSTITLSVIVGRDGTIRSIDIKDNVPLERIKAHYMLSIIMQQNSTILTAPSTNELFNVLKNIVENLNKTPPILSDLASLPIEYNKDISLSRIDSVQYIGSIDIINDYTMDIILRKISDNKYIVITSIYKILNIVDNVYIKYRILTYILKSIGNSSFMLSSIDYEPYNIVINDLSKIREPSEYKTSVIEHFKKWLRDNRLDCRVENAVFSGAFVYDYTITNDTKLLKIEYTYIINPPCKGFEYAVIIDPATGKLISIEPRGTYTYNDKSVDIFNMYFIAVLAAATAIVIALIVYMKKH